MAKIFYQYFKKDIDQNKILVRINPATFEGLEILVAESGKVAQNTRQFDSTIYDDLEFDAFEEANALEFNLYLAGINK